MPNNTKPVEIIAGRERRRRYGAEQKLALIEETMQPSMTVPAVARLHGVSPSLLFKWRLALLPSCPWSELECAVVSFSAGPSCELVGGQRHRPVCGRWAR
jgi:hypothetical protein